MQQDLEQRHLEIMRLMLKLAYDNSKSKRGRPFAACIADEGQIIGQGVNTIHQTQDMTAHAEMEAIRECCRSRHKATLEGLTVYATGHPCPMCLAAIVAGNAKQVFFAFDNADAAPYGLSSEGTYQRLGIRLNPPPLPITRLDVGVTAAQLYGDEEWPLK